MAVADSIDLRSYCLETAERARAAAGELARTSGAVKNAWLRRSAELLRSGQRALAEANARDLAAAPQFGLTDAQIDRLRLTPKVDRSRWPAALEEVAALPDPIGEVIESIDPPQRPGSAQGPRAAGRRVLHLRIAAQRDGRRRRHLRQERQRRDPARRQGSGPLEPGHRRAAGRGRRTRSACPPTPCSWSTRPTARPSAISWRCPNTSTWRFRAAAKA